MSQTLLADKITALVTNQISLTDFQTATSPAALQTAVSAASLPGSPSSPPATKKKSDAVAIGVGEWASLAEGGGRCALPAAAGCTALGPPPLPAPAR